MRCGGLLIKFKIIDIIRYVRSVIGVEQRLDKNNICARTSIMLAPKSEFVKYI